MNFTGFTCVTSCFHCAAAGFYDFVDKDEQVSPDFVVHVEYIRVCKFRGSFLISECVRLVLPG